MTKKIVMLVVLLFCSFVLVSCGDKSTEETLQNLEFKLLENKIRNKVGRYEMVEFKDLTTTKGLLGNCNIQYLQDNSEYEFPEGLDANILLLENLKIGGSR